MSLLLDALKRSEAAREQTLKSRLGHAGPAPAVARRRAPWMVAVVILVCVNAGLAAIWIEGGIPLLSSTHHEANSPASVETMPGPRPEVRSLAHAAAVGQRAPAGTPNRAAQATQSAKHGIEPGATAAPAEPTASADSDQNAPPLAKLPQTVKRKLPDLHMQIHVYADKPSNRFVMINMQRAAEGDVLPSGVKVMHIRPDGVVLGFRGRSFLLPTHSP
jgi:general secretion pathway protein B